MGTAATWFFSAAIDSSLAWNSGVAQNGGYFLGINYGRLARLRPVTGCAGAYDWTKGVAAPENDGIFLVEIESAKKRFLVSFRQLAPKGWSMVSVCCGGSGPDLKLEAELADFKGSDERLPERVLRPLHPARRRT